MKKILLENTKGQILVIFAVSLIGLLILGALVIDGGQSFVHRRQAQAAADAGALAGAQAICEQNKTAAEAKTLAENYATVENLATTANAIVVIDKKDGTSVTVNVTVHQKSFLAQLLGYNSLDITATAEAICVSGANVLPVAWSCKTDPEAGECFESVEWEDLKDEVEICMNVPGNNTSEKIAACLYSSVKIKYDVVPVVFMDSDEINIDHCIPNGTMDCDADNDGKMDFNVMAGRSWLNLTGQGASGIGDVLEYGVQPPIKAHDWVLSKEGSVAAAYGDALDCILGEGNGKPCNTTHNPVILPIANAICKAANPTTDPVCQALAHPEGFDGADRIWCFIDNTKCETLDPTKDDIYFHIVGSADMYVTCIRKTGGSKCPAADLLGTIYKDYKNNKTIEGYFIRGYTQELVNAVFCDPGFGGCSASLIK